MSTRKTSAEKPAPSAKNGNPRPKRAKQPSRAKAREGKKAVVGYFSPELSKQVQILAIQEDKSMQALLGEAIDMLLQDRGLPAAGER